MASSRPRPPRPPLQLGQPGADLVADQRVQDRLEVAQRGRIGEDDLAQRRRLDGAEARLDRRRASASLLRISRATASASMTATPRSRSIAPRCSCRSRCSRSGRSPSCRSLFRAAAGNAGRSACCAARPRCAGSARAAAQAGLAGAPVDPPAARRCAGSPSAPDIVAEARAPVADALAQADADGPMEPPHLVRCQGVGATQRIEPCAPQRLIGVDVADAGDERLVEQQRLEARAPSVQPLGQPRRAEAGLSGSGPWRANTSPTRYGAVRSPTVGRVAGGLARSPPPSHSPIRPNLRTSR